MVATAVDFTSVERVRPWLERSGNGEHEGKLLLETAKVGSVAASCKFVSLLFARWLPMEHQLHRVTKSAAPISIF